MRRLAPLACLLPALALAQTNLQFQEGVHGQAPPGWFVLDMAKDARFTALWQREGCRGDSPCAVLEAPANPPAGAFGTLMQSFDARPLRGRNVLLRAWVRLEPKAPGDHAQMLLHVSRPNLQPGFVDNMADRPITAAEWRQYEIRGDVAADAESIGVGISMYGAGRVWIGGVEFGVVALEDSGPKVDAARDAIRKQYARMDAAFVHGNAAEIGAVLLPGAEMRVGTIREPLLPAIEKELSSKGAKLATQTEVSSVRLDGDEAVAMVRREAVDPLAAVKRGVVTSHRDTWVQAAGGWRLRESLEVSFHWVIPATKVEEARPVAAELKTQATPLDDSTSLAAFGTAVADARVVVLGEAAHFTREFAQWKLRLTEYLVTRKGFTVVAGANDTEARALVERLHAESVPIDGATLEERVASMLRLADVTRPQAKIVVWTDNAHARDPQLRDKLGKKLYALGFAFYRGEVRAVGVEHGESRGLGIYTAAASPEGSGDAVLKAAGIPQFFLNFAHAAFAGPLGRWLAGEHLFHDLGAYWVLDDPDASLQPETLDKCYNGLVYIEDIHAGG